MLGCAGTPFPAASAPELSPTPAARCTGTGSLGASTCGVICAMLISPRFNFNWSGDSGGSTTDGCASSGMLSFDFIFDTSAVGSTTVCCVSVTCVFDFSFDTSAVGSTTCCVNCGNLSCDNWRDDAAIGCPGMFVQATMLGNGTSRFSFTCGGVTIVW